MKYILLHFLKYTLYKLMCRDYTSCEQEDSVLAMTEALSKPLETMVKAFITSSQGEGQDFIGAFEKYLEKAGPTCMDLTKKLYRYKGGFQTLCLTDTWFNNMLFK